MKSALLVAMLTGRVFLVNWHEPVPLDAAAAGATTGDACCRARDDHKVLRLPLPVSDASCLPFATATHLPHRLAPAAAQVADLRGRCWRAPLEVFTTDLNIYLADNPHYEAATPPRCGLPEGWAACSTVLTSPRVLNGLRRAPPPVPGGDGGDGGGICAVHGRAGAQSAVAAEHVGLASRVVGCSARGAEAARPLHLRRRLASPRRVRSLASASSR